MKRILFLSIQILLFAFTSNLFAQLSIVPKPKEVTKTGENFSITNSTFSIRISVKDTSGIYIPINELRETFQLIKGFDIHVNNKSSRLIWFGIPSEDKKFKQACEENEIVGLDKIGEEGYALSIKNNLILIAANTGAGLYYGVQSLKQLIRGNKNNFSLPGVKIVDWPSLRYRGILDDISRGPVPTMDYMKQQVRRLAELKMNTLQYYTEHVVKTKKHSAFAPPDGSITVEDIRELSGYAAKYHVTLIGNFQSFGHFDKILSHPDYSHLGERGNLLSPAFPESIELLRDIYSEIIPAYNSPIFNINADETFDLGKGASKQMVDSIGLGVVYTDHIKKIHNIVTGLNTRLMMSQDMLLKNPGSFERLPKDIIIMVWGYDDDESFDNIILPVKEAGFVFTVSPGILNTQLTMPHYSVTVKNMKNIIRDGIKHGAMGMIIKIWDDGGSAFFSRDWYGIAYGADHSWNSNNETIPEFDERFNTSVYGDHSGNFTKALWKLVELADVPATDRLQEKLLWTKVIPDSGETLRIGTEGLEKAKEIINTAEMLLNNSVPLLYRNDIDYFQFTVYQYRYFANLIFNLLETSQLYSDAFKIHNEDKYSARKKILNAIDLIGNSRVELAGLYINYRNLWLNENKTYSVDIVLNKYQDQMNDLTDIEERIFSSLKNLDSDVSLQPPVEVRLGIQKGEGKYFRDWMMTNPIPISEIEKNISVDYLKEMGGELNTVPGVAQEFKFKDDTYRWRRTASEYFDIVDAAKEFSDSSNNSVTYAFAHIDSPDDRVVQASLGSIGRVVVILNGKLIHSVRKYHPLNVDQDRFHLQLRKGRNNLMLKLFREDKEWKFTFRLPDINVSNNKNRYRIQDEE